MPASVLLLGASVAARVASLNLCTDEYLLLLAPDRQIVGISYLSRDPLESPLWRKARHFPGNRGSLEDVLPQRPNLVLTMSGGGRATSLLAKSLHIRVLDVPFAATLEDVERNLVLVADALGDRSRAKPLLNRIEQLKRTAPSQAADSIWISGHGDSLRPQLLGARWLRLAGFQQRALPGGRVTFEDLVTKPPKYLIKSDYRSGQVSSAERWLDSPIVRRLAAQTVTTDGRPWTCLGPMMVFEIERLKKVAH